MSEQVPGDVRILLEKGVELAEVLHKFFQTHPISPMTNWENKYLFLACLTYSCSLAKLVEMDRDDFMLLSTQLYDNIQITLPAPPKQPNGEDEMDE